MFSMKYTSPKVTPKKAVPSSTPSPVDPSPPSSTRAASPVVEADADLHSIRYNAASEKILNLAKNGCTGEDAAARPRPRPSKRSGGGYESAATESEPSLAASNHLTSTLTKENLSSNANGLRYNRAESAMSEHESAMADFSKEEKEPRSNLMLALLDREYAKNNVAGSSSGEEECNPKMPQNAIEEDAANTGRSFDPDDANDAVVAANMVDGISDDEQSETDDMPSLQSVIQSSSPSRLSKAFSLHETADGSFGYRRSDSMEPLGMQAEEALLRPPRITDAQEDPVDETETPVVEQPDVLINSSDSVEAETKDSELASPKRKPTIYDISAQSASPIMSEINSSRFGGGSSAASASEVGGDTYFDEPPIADTIDDDLVHVTLPPRVNRTTAQGYPNNIGAPFLPPCPSSTRSQPLLPTQSPLPVISLQRTPPFPMSPRQPFSHTHSLLDDCSDEEDDIESTTFNVVDSPTRHMASSYSCLPRPRSNSEGGSSPFSSYFKGHKQKHNGRAIHGRSSNNDAAGTNATRVATNNIQQALLQTRHRRWDCVSAYAGAHAQSCRVFDLTSRVHYLAGCTSDEEGVGALAARLSVSPEAIRAAALASGLWRTVRLVRLPRGLFRSNDGSVTQSSLDGNDVWPLLKMLNSTFPMLDQVDFGGDISRLAAASKNMADGEDWRAEILSCIMECLPSIVAVDGFVVESQEPESCGERPPNNKDETAVLRKGVSNMMNGGTLNRQETNVSENTAACVECDSDSFPMCGYSDLGEDPTVQLDASTGVSYNNIDSVRHRPREISSASRPSKRSDLADNPMDGLSENIITLSEGTLASNHYPSNLPIDEEMQKMPALSSSSSMLSSSRSWGSNGSGTRPPPCPASTNRGRPRLPANPAERKKKSKKGSFVKSSGLKRRVLGLIPSVSVMDDDEDEDDDDDEDEDEDEDSDDSETEAENDCPTDML